MRIILSLIFIFACVFGGFVVAGGNLAIAWQPAEVVMIFGAGLGALFFGNPRYMLKKIAKHAKLAFKPRNEVTEREYYLELMAVMQSLIVGVKKNGIKSLDEHIDSPESSSMFLSYPLVLERKEIVTFLADGLRMSAMGSIKPHEFEALLETETNTILENNLHPASAVKHVGDALPGYGIMAAVLGIVITMASIDGTIAQIGMLISIALMGTFMGIFGCYCIVGPLGSAMQNRQERDIVAYHVVRMTLTAYVSNKSVVQSIDAGRRMLPFDLKPDFSEMETWLDNQDV